jgi:pimeloyl-ACP methyl ester carboxylesterase
MTTIFLPDFVGYPLCYLALRRQLPDDARAVFLDYNGYWPYASVTTLVDAIAAALPVEDVTTIVGYSFGAHVAVMLAERLRTAPALVLIAPPAIATMPPRSAAEIEALLRSRDDYAYVFDAVACELTSLDCMVANIAMLARLPARRRVGAPGTLFLAGDDAVVAELDADLLEIVRLDGCDHRSILLHPLVVARLLAL